MEQQVKFDFNKRIQYHCNEKIIIVRKIINSKLLSHGPQRYHRNIIFRNFCVVTGSARTVRKITKSSRHCARDYIWNALTPFIKKSSW